MVLLAIVSAENVQFLVEESGCVILYLRGLDALIIPISALSVGVIIGWIGQVVQEAAEAAVPRLSLILVLITFPDKNPFEPLRRLLPRRGN